MSSSIRNTIVSTINDESSLEISTQSLDLKFRIEYERTVQRLVHERIDADRKTIIPGETSESTPARSVENEEVSDRFVLS